MGDGINVMVKVLVGLVGFGVFVTILAGASILGNASFGSFAGVTQLLGLAPLIITGSFLGGLGVIGYYFVRRYRR